MLLIIYGLPQLNHPFLFPDSLHLHVFYVWFEMIRFCLQKLEDWITDLLGCSSRICSNIHRHRLEFTHFLFQFFDIRLWWLFIFFRFQWFIQLFKIGIKSVFKDFKFSSLGFELLEWHLLQILIPLKNLSVIFNILFHFSLIEKMLNFLICF